MSRKQFLFFLVFWFFGCFQAKRSPFDTSTPSGVTFNIFAIELQKQRVATPTFSPSAGVITSFTKITISTSTSGATIYYTTDGSNPSRSSIQYTSPIENVWTLAGKTIKAFAVKSGMFDSEVLSGMFIYPNLTLTTGQTTSYGAGDDGAHQLGVSRSFTDNGDGTVTDNAIGLVWQKCSHGRTGSDCSNGSIATANWTAAQNHCNTSTLAGRTRRLPTIQELQTLVQYGTTSAINQTYFPRTETGRNYWSSTAYAPNTNMAWGVNFDDGTISYPDKNNSHYVRCVSGP